FHLSEKKMYTFTSNDCEFNYRESIFKKRYKDEFVIMNVTFKLSKQPVFNISYGAIKQELEKMNIHNLSIKAISQAVIKIRSSKLPDPKVTGNAGSFFKNPEVDKQKYDFLKTNYAQIPGYLLDSGKIKVAAGWLIEQCGWKGFRRGDAGCHADQALVLVNYGHATGGEIYDLSEKIKQSVKQKFDIDLEREVNII
ncbi:MAG: UDP-N-acetylenolpyruvoylglucosamine reductase, partial [Chitinophagaceae bacterium]|nr:UDP-N-acetylenolpyruvoylglucosamine reductase [Chitinophagaceae bacterium]